MTKLIILFSFLTGTCLGYISSLRDKRNNEKPDVNIRLIFPEKEIKDGSKVWTEQEIYDLIKAQDDFHKKQVEEPINDTEDLLGTVSDLLSGKFSIEDFDSEGDE